MAERRPDLAREHRLHDCFRGPPRALPVRFQHSRCRGRPIERREAVGVRGASGRMPRFPGPATRRLGRLRRESERSTPNGRAKTLWWWWWWWWWCAHQLRITYCTSGRLPRIWGSINYYTSTRESLHPCTLITVTGWTPAPRAPARARAHRLGSDDALDGTRADFRKKKGGLRCVLHVAWRR